MRSKIHFFIFLSQFIFVYPVLGQAQVLLKKDVLNILKDKSVRWRQTQYFSNEADAKLEQVKSANGIRLSFYSRAVIARTSQLFFGFLDSGPVNTVGFGATGLQAEYLMYNKTFSEKIEAAEENIKVSLENTKVTQNDLQFLALQKYLFTQYQEKRLESADLAIKKSLEVVRLAKEKTKAGHGVPIDIARSEALLEKDKIKKIEIEAAHYKSKEEFFDLIGQTEIKRLPKLRYRKIGIEKKENLDEMLKIRPEIKLTEFQLSALQHMKKSIDGEQGIRITTFAEVGTIGTQTFGLLNSPTGSVGVQFEYPILDGGLNNGRKREILNQISQVSLENQKLKDENNIKLDVALEQLRLSDLAAAGTEIQLKYAQTELDLAEKKIKFGSAGNLELVNAQNNYALALEANTQAIYTYEISKLNLFYTTSDLDGYLKACEEDTNG